jgi:hypothetical protein
VCLIFIDTHRDEPAVLAQLLRFAPASSRGRIEQRISDLRPVDSGQILLITEAQARIDELLSAGQGDAAARFMQAELALKQPWGDASGREMQRLHATLRLHLLRGDWEAIDRTAPSNQLSPSEHRVAEDSINFYRAIAAIRQPGGNVGWAEETLNALHSRRPEVAAYTINLFAARISILCRTGLYTQLPGGAIESRKAAVDSG